MNSVPGKIPGGLSGREGRKALQAEACSLPCAVAQGLPAAPVSSLWDGDAGSV